MSTMSLRSPARPYRSMMDSHDSPRCRSAVEPRTRCTGCSKPHPNRRKRPSHSASLYRIITGGIIAMCLAHVNAQPQYDGYVVEAAPYMGDGFTDIIFDETPPPRMPVQVQRREETHSSKVQLPASIAPPSSTQSSESSVSTSATVQTASGADNSPLPVPLDANIGNNFTASTCSSFFQTLRQDATFEACHPLSLLLQTSNSFFAASHSNVSLERAIEASCNVDFATCSNLMAGYAQQIKQDGYCGADAALENPIVLQTYYGLAAYESLYWAGCLRIDGGDGYCIVDAMTNSSTPTSSYIYYLPLGVSLPAGTRPPCDICLHDTMNIFQKSANNGSSILSRTYDPAAQMIDINCGPTFVAASVVNTSAAGRSKVVQSVREYLPALAMAGFTALLTFVA